MAYSLDEIYVESELVHTGIEEIYISHKPNMHPFLRLECAVDIDTRDVYSNLYDSRISLQIVEGEILFEGIIKEFTLKRQGHTQSICLKAYGNSIQVDKEKNTRLFQDGNLSYSEISAHILSEQSAQQIVRKDASKTNAILLQYHETDWEFLKRIAALDQTLILSSINALKPSIYYGIEREEVALSLKEDFYESVNSIREDRGEYSIQGLQHFFHLEEDYPLGATVKYKNTDFIIYEKEVKSEGGILYFYYRICERTGIAPKPRYQREIRGLVLPARVEDVKEESVYLKFPIDATLGSEKHAFDWIPITGNVLYCMPEIASVVKVYFGNKDERKDVYAIECINEEEDFDSYKGIRTRAGKSFKMSGNKLLLKTDSESELQVTNYSLSVQTGGDVEAGARKKIKIKSDMLEINAYKDINLLKT